jgi:uroporphyrin-III C-methyltransferase/precorrin-2 dehydrogenase/sirohydrochlorin ferrochelatase
MHSLPLFVRLQGRPVILLGDGEAADAKRRLLDRAGAQIVGEDGVAALAIVALDDEDAATAAIARLKARGVLVNAVDRPADCDFTLPAIVDRDPVIIAIGTGGVSAGLAKALRIRLEAMIPQGLGVLANGLQGARTALKARFPDAADRRRVIDAALAPGSLLDPLTDHDKGDVAAWLEAAEAPAGDALHIFTLTSDDPDDLTLAQARLLGQADYVMHHPSIPPSILARARADAVRIAADAPPAAPGKGLTLYLGRR